MHRIFIVLAAGLVLACNPDVAPEPPRAAFVEITPRQASISAIGDVA